MKVPLTKPYVGLAEAEAVSRVLESRWLAQGSQVSLFEDMVAGYTGAKYAVAVCNGTAALHLALEVIGITTGDQVWLPSFGFPATANAAWHCGANPEFITEEEPNKPVTIAVHLFGEITPQNRLGYQVHDCCCSLGAENLPIDTLSCLSFHPKKVITTGEGGMVLTNNKEMAEELRVLRAHGKQKSGGWSVGAYNYRMSDVQAALGVAQMARLYEILYERNRLAYQYDKKLPSTLIRAPHSPDRVYQSYVCQYEGDRDKLIEDLAEKGVETTVGGYACHRLWGLRDEDYLHSAWLADHTIALPIYPEMTEEEQTYVIDSIREVLDV